MRVKSTFKFPNGNVATCDENGEQIPKLQGVYTQLLHAKISALSDENTQWNGFKPLFVLNDIAKKRLKRLEDLGAKIEVSENFNAPTIALWDIAEKETWTWIHLDHIDSYSDEDFEDYYMNFVDVSEKNKKYQSS
jgi:hypothetical protein